MADITLTVPNTAVPRIRRVFGGGTNAETLALVQAFLLAQLRLKIRQDNEAETRATAQVAVQAALTADAAGFDTDWPAT